MNVRGTVINVRLSPTEGSEQAGTRPAVVISPTFINERSELLIVLPVTSRKIDKIYPFEVFLDPESCGLSLPSKAMANQIRVVSKQRVVGTFGVVGKETMRQVDEALKLATGLIEI